MNERTRLVLKPRRQPRVKADVTHDAPAWNPGPRSLYLVSTKQLFQPCSPAHASEV